MKILLFGLLLAVAVHAQTPKPGPTLDERMRAEIAGFKGKVWVYAKNLDTGAVYSYNGPERVRTASTIKLAIMIEAFAQVAEGKIKWTDDNYADQRKESRRCGHLVRVCR